MRKALPLLITLLLLATGCSESINGTATPTPSTFTSRRDQCPIDMKSWTGPNALAELGKDEALLQEAQRYLESTERMEYFKSEITPFVKRVISGALNNKFGEFKKSTQAPGSTAGFDGLLTTNGSASAAFRWNSDGSPNYSSVTSFDFYGLSLAMQPDIFTDNPYHGIIRKHWDGCTYLQIGRAEHVGGTTAGASKYATTLDELKEFDKSLKPTLDGYAKRAGI